MNDSTTLWIQSLIFGLILSAIISALMMSQMKVLRKVNSNLETTIQKRDETIERLLNRLQSGDLRTFHSLVTSSEDKPEQEYIVRTDQAELEILSAAAGLGNAIYDDGIASEFADTLSEFGINSEHVE